MLTGGKLSLAALMLGAAATPAMAQDSEWLPGNFSANVAITNDYVFRGFTQNQENAAIQGGFDWDHDVGVYIGTWASNYQFGIPGEGSLEWRAYGGYRKTFGDLTVDVGAIGYMYPGTTKSLDYQWWEARGKVSYDFGVASVSAGVNYTPEFIGGLGKGWYYSGAVAVPLNMVIEGLAIDANVGRTDLTDNTLDYTDYGIGLSYDMKWFKSEVRYVNTDVKNCKDICDSRVVFKISRTF